MFYKAYNSKLIASSIPSESINYKNRLKTPVQIDVAPSNITITAYIDFAPNMQKTAEFGEETYEDLTIQGIKEFWGKEYTTSDNQKINVNVVIINKNDPSAVYDPKQRFFKISYTKFYKTSFVMSPAWRWIWGIFFTFCPESVMLNWTVTRPGHIFLHKYLYSQTVKKVVAHEFGHILGLGDAYGAHYRFFYEAPGTSDYMMNSNKCVNINELMMAINAHKTNRMQYFPFKVSFIRYFKEGIDYQYKSIRTLFRKLLKVHSHKNNIE